VAPLTCQGTAPQGSCSASYPPLLGICRATPKGGSTHVVWPLPCPCEARQVGLLSDPPAPRTPPSGPPAGPRRRAGEQPAAQVRGQAGESSLSPSQA